MLIDFLFSSHAGFDDEMGWAAAWLYRATDNPLYLEIAHTWLERFSWVPWAFSWADKTAGAHVSVQKIKKLKLISINIYGCNTYACDKTYCMTNIAKKRERERERERADYCCGILGFTSETL